MAYNSYFPASYQPLYYQPQYQPQQPQPVQMQQPQQQPSSFSSSNQSNGLIWVQGEAGAKSYLVAPNNTVMLMDSESEQFFLKSADASGMPLPLRVFKYSEVSKSQNETAKIGSLGNSSEYVLKSEFEAFKGQIDAFLNEGAGSGKHEKEADNE